MSTIQRFFNSPLALSPDHTGILIDALERGEEVNENAIVVTVSGEARPYDLIDGVAIIPIGGVLVHQAAWWFDETAYGWIEEMLATAIGDPEVKAIALLIYSPGGEVSGMYDLADTIYSLRGVKPIWAILDECAFSAAYALASSADVITVPRTGGTGSIGVIAMHVEISEALAEMGVKVTLVTYGKRKADYQPVIPLSDEARAGLQSDVDFLGEMFVALVARNRGIDPGQVRQTEAGVFMGQTGVDAGLADMVLAPDEALLALLGEISTPKETQT
jgi:signal peptide peptidase SppA